ncbi:MAG: hypothetical protein AABX38_00820 [Candidatus Micrarchaeota archaeon]
MSGEFIKKCIICQKDIENENAVKVKDDKIITTIRAIKTKLNAVKGNELYVCEKDLEVHAKKRKTYEKDTFIAMVIAGLAFLFLLLLPIIQGRIDIQFIIASLIICLAIVFMAVILKYVPATQETKLKSSVQESVSVDQYRVSDTKKKKTQLNKK